MSMSENGPQTQLPKLDPQRAVDSLRTAWAGQVSEGTYASDEEVAHMESIERMAAAAESRVGDPFELGLSAGVGFVAGRLIRRVNPDTLASAAGSAAATAGIAGIKRLLG